MLNLPIKKFRPPMISWLDLLILSLLFVGGFFYMHDPLYWGNGWIGTSQYGDAEFWWDGALHAAHGFFQDNPGKGYRPGYFLFTGLTLPVLGEQFKQYYPYFLGTFLSVASFFYLALRHFTGKWIAACAVALLIFNPYTAEWVATSTTDATGLLLNLAGLSCLLYGVRQGIDRYWLIAFAIFFALGSLTRPLLTPFIGLVGLSLFFFSEESFKKRLFTIICLFLAFCIPTLVWMSIQKLTIDRWALSSNDASAFYAASDPNTQVWNNEMYDRVKKIAADRYHVKDFTKVNDVELNSVFWSETINNYLHHPVYHLRRIFPHIWRVVTFSPMMAEKPTERWQKLLLSFAAFGLALSCLFQDRKKRIRAFLLLVLAVGLLKVPFLVACMTGAGVVLALLKRHGKIQLGFFLLSLYWLTGVAALYFVGGTWGKPSFSPVFTLNALGYRLGSQFFFVGDLLAAYFLFWVASLDKNKMAHSNFNSLQTFIHQPSPFAGRVILGITSAFLLAITTVYVIGSTIVLQRGYSHSHGVIENYPDLTSIQNLYLQKTGRKLLTTSGYQGGLDEKNLLLLKNPDTELLFTGAVSSFIWNMQGQPRAQLLVHTQKQMSPFTMGPNYLILEVPEHLNIQDWAGIQGAFIIQQLPNKHNDGNIAYYLTTPVIRAFIPLSADKKNFALDKILWYPLIKNATQLESMGELQGEHAKFIWAQSSGEQKFQRRFMLVPQSENPAELLLQVHGASTLSFSFADSDLPDKAPQKFLSGNYKVEISILKKGMSQFQQIEEFNLPEAVNASLQKIKLSLPENTQAIKIAFDKLSANRGIWIYEFNLITSDKNL